MNFEENFEADNFQRLCWVKDYLEFVAYLAKRTKKDMLAIGKKMIPKETLSVTVILKMNFIW